MLESQAREGAWEGCPGQLRTAWCRDSGMQPPLGRLGFQSLPWGPWYGPRRAPGWWVVERTGSGTHRVGHKILAVTGVTWGVFLSFLTPPSLGLLL